MINASQVANSKTGVKDFIPVIDYSGMTVTFNLVMGIYDFDFVLYLRMDASNSALAGFEGGIYAPAPGLSPGNGSRLSTMPRQTIMPILNGILGVENFYERQGLQSGALGEGDPFNVLGALPGEASDYSPIWDVTPGVWSQAAIAAGKRQRMHQDDEVRAFVASDGDLVSYPGATGNFNSDIGLTSLGVVSNCPVMLRIMSGVLPYPPAPSTPPRP